MQRSLITYDPCTAYAFEEMFSEQWKLVPSVSHSFWNAHCIFLGNRRSYGAWALGWRGGGSYESLISCLIEYLLLNLMIKGWRKNWEKANYYGNVWLGYLVTMFLEHNQSHFHLTLFLFSDGYGIIIINASFSCLYSNLVCFHDNNVFDPFRLKNFTYI